jgi:predicted aspartyl protease
LRSGRIGRNLNIMVGWLPLALTALFSGASLPLQSVPPIPLIAAEQPPLPEDALGFDTVESRMTVPVSIGGRGPYRFVVDTGAQRTIVSRDLAGLLGLQAGRQVRVTAMTGTATVETVEVPSLSVSRIQAGGIEAPALNQADMGAPGMLGIDALQGHAVSIDFARNEMTVRPSHRHHSVAAGPNDIVVTARNRFGQLIVTDARCEGRKVAVVIDTGTAITVANSAFIRMLKDRPTPLGKISLISALGELMTADYVAVDRIKIGEVAFNNVPMAVADVAPFKRFGLTDQPALLLGMDALRLFDEVQIDFANREIRFSLPDAHGLGHG